MKIYIIILCYVAQKNVSYLFQKICIENMKNMQANRKLNTGSVLANTTLGEKKTTNIYMYSIAKTGKTV